MFNSASFFRPMCVLLFGATTDLFAAMPFPTWVLNFGALGLCAYMIWRNEARQKDLIRVIDKQQDKSEEKNKRMEKLVDDHAKSNNRLAEALEHRPCLANDRVIGKIKGE